MNTEFYNFYFKVIIPWPCNPTKMSIHFFKVYENVIDKTFQNVLTNRKGKKH